MEIIKLLRMVRRFTLLLVSVSVTTIAIIAVGYAKGGHIVFRYVQINNATDDTLGLSLVSPSSQTDVDKGEYIPKCPSKPTDNDSCDAMVSKGQNTQECYYPDTGVLNGNDLGAGDTLYIYYCVDPVKYDDDVNKMQTYIVDWDNGNFQVGHPDCVASEYVSANHADHVHMHCRSADMQSPYKLHNEQVHKNEDIVLTIEKN